MSLLTRRPTRHPQSAYRHPVTGIQVKFNDLHSFDAEADCLEAASMIHDYPRMRELSQQSAQNRTRIVKRCFGDTGLVPPVDRADRK